MRRGAPAAVLLAAALAVVPSNAQASGVDAVEVTGRTFRGQLVEVRPHVLVRIRTSDTDEVTVPWSEIVAIHRADGEPVLPAMPAASGTGSPVADVPRHWYGWQSLLVDAGSLVLMPLGGAGLVTYAAGPPIVHAAHGRGGPALASILLRVGLPLVLGAVGLGIGAAASPSNQSNEGPALGPVVGALAGLGVGVLGAMAIDDAVIAWEPARAAHAARSGAASGLAVVPWLTLGGDVEHSHAGWLGIVGVF
jgi:hypothetical protein